MTLHRVAKRRISMGIIAVALVPIGLSARYLGAGLVADLSGGVLYAALFYALLALILPRVSARSIALLCLSWCVGIEFLQLSGLPETLAAHFPVAHLVLGSHFAPLDLLAYLLGAALGWALDSGIARMRRKPRTVH